MLFKAKKSDPEENAVSEMFNLNLAKKWPQNGIPTQRTPR
jgi:hypothetical protein